jgi:quercetin dioxygenase-like cupin family protein
MLCRTMPQHWDLNELDVKPHAPMVLSSTDEARTIVLQLPAGEALQEHQVHERAWVLVLSGDVEIGTPGGGEAISGGPGLMIQFEPQERHDVRAREDSRLLLWLAPWPGAGHPSRR